MIGLQLSHNPFKALWRRALSSRCSQEWLKRERPVTKALLTTAFSGLNLQHAYDIAFYGNLSTTDPLGRCRGYLGTDQREYIAGFLEDEFSALPPRARVADIGAGDGQTFALGESENLLQV